MQKCVKIANDLEMKNKYVKMAEFPEAESNVRMRKFFE
jgi:hypothetical protein